MEHFTYFRVVYKWEEWIPLKKGCGPSQIANKLKEEKILTPTAYHKSHGRNTPNAEPSNPYGWNSNSILKAKSRSKLIVRR